MNELGFIKLSRKLLKWQWIEDPKMVSLWIHLLLMANHKETKWNGITVKRGQSITGLHSLSKSTGISIRSLRTCLTKLKSTGELTIKSTNKYSIITICNYDNYQFGERGTDKQNDKQNDKRPTSHRQTTDNKQEYIKNEKNDNIVFRKKKFEEKVLEFENEFDYDLLRRFIDYWTEESHDGTEMRFDQTKFWNMRFRIESFTIND
jgi:hypothetical protein